MTTLADKIHNGPVFLSLLQVFDSEIHGLVSPQSASQQKSQKRTVTFAFHLGVVRTLPQRARLLCRQPVSHPYAIFLQALYPPDPGSQIGAEQTTVGSFVSQPPNSTQPKVNGSGGQPSGF
jgi:hypothetical protein